MLFAVVMRESFLQLTSKVKVMVIPTNEEVMIARDTVRILGL